MFEWSFPMICFSVLASVASYQSASVTICLWYNNSCVDSCPDWMIAKKSNCNETYWVAPKTCDQPEEKLVGTVCGFSRCDCPEPTVLDADTGFCYDIDNCPTKHVL